MGTTDFGLQSMTARHLDFIAYNQKGIVGVLDDDAGLERAILPEQLPGGWTARWVATHAKRNAGMLVILPTDERTRDIFYFATLKRCQNAGLTFEVAKAVTKLKVRFKNEILDEIIEILKPGDSPAITAFAALEETTQFDDWYRLWHETLPDCVKDFDVPRMRSLAAAVHAVKRITIGIKV